MGIVTDIQRFSLNDGPGIRTTVFFKGCNVNCAWCHNPETLVIQPELLIDPSRCVGCGACVGFSPERAKKGLPPEREEMTPATAEECFTGALMAAGREMTAEDVISEVAEDIPYYETSGGGVTLSGGEVMMQPHFAKEILKQLKARGIETAIETNLIYDYSHLESLLPWIDLVMADIKLLNDDFHEKYIGAGNEQVLKNVRELAASGRPFILRTPVIPGVNDSEQEIAAIAAFIAEAGGNLLYYELLNFNPLGDSKYTRLDLKNAFRDERPLSNEQMERLRDIAARFGIPVRVG